MSNTGFLVLHLGGTGALAARPLRELWRADGRRFPLYQVLLDTDKANEPLKEEGVVDDTIPVRLAYDELETVKATPGSFGPVVERIVTQVAAMLDPEEMENGARTLRACAQLPWEVRRLQVADRLNECIREFRRHDDPEKIIPIGATSTGGGTGSAISVLLGAALREKTFRDRVVQGLNGKAMLRTLNLFAVEPFYRTFANADDPNHVARILANAKAFREETEYLERRGCFDSIYHFGGVLDSERDVSRVLGTSLYHYMRYWECHIKPLKVNRPLSSRYGGQDTRERKVQWSRTLPEPSNNGQPAASSNPNGPCC